MVAATDFYYRFGFIPKFLNFVISQVEILTYLLFFLLPNIR